MNNSLHYRHSDLAVESLTKEPLPPRGVTVCQEHIGALEITTVRILENSAADSIGKPVGRYVTVSFPDFFEQDDSKTERSLSLSLAERLLALLPSPSPRRVLVAGLGNRAITADALGPFTQEKLRINGHLEEKEAAHPSPRLFAFAPGVMGKTGMETLSLVRGAVKAASADLLIVVDSLVAAETERLGRTVQLSDTGLIPGSGVGNHRAALNRDSLGIPVIAIGVPLVVSSATLVYDTLTRAGIDRFDGAVKEVLDRQESYFVTKKSCDLACVELSKVIANAINRVFSQ